MGVAFALVVFLAVMCSGCATPQAQVEQSTTEKEGVYYEVEWSENAVYLRMSTGERMVCLVTAEGSGFTGVPGWFGFTCTDVRFPENWRFCAGKEDAPILGCAPPGKPVREDGKVPEPEEADVQMGIVS